MSTTMQRHLSLTILAVLLMGMGLAAGLAWLAVENLFLSTLRENLLAQATLTAAALQGEPLPAGNFEAYAQTANVLPGIHTRLLGEEGGVVVGLPLVAEAETLPAPAAENTVSISTEELRRRPEIQAAIQGKSATAVRRVSGAGNRRVLYAAAPVFTDTGEIAGLVYLATPLPPGNLPLSASLQLLGAVGIAALLAGGVGVWLARRIARPLAALASAADAIAEGELEQRVSGETRIQELDRLRQAFNRMSANLQQAEQAKNAFLADVTHELRTPLTVIKGTIETLEDGALDDAEGRGPLLQGMQRESERLIRLVNDLLVLARADAGALNLKIEPLDLAELARARGERLALLAAPRAVTVDVVGQEGMLVCGDPDRLSQVLDNLLDNAIRHAPERSTVTVQIQAQGERVHCAVSDRGPGIPAVHQTLIFERFYRAEGARDRHSGGSGLGLAIVKALVTAQGGNVSVESAPGEGTTLRFWLPIGGNCYTID